MSYTIILVVTVVTLGKSVFTVADSGPYVQPLGTADFYMFKSNPGVRLVYFFKEAVLKDASIQQKSFLKEYEKSAQLIKNYDVEFGRVDCPNKGAPEYCDRPNIEKKVVVFRNGLELLSLDLENMFDIDSIVSNVLQIVLLKEVPIVQKQDEKILFLNKFKGKFDVILSYQHAIGTHAHRVFMEVAFAYQSKYKFTLTTEKELAKGMIHYNDQEETAIWLLRCKEASDKLHDCQEYKYWDNMDLMSLARNDIDASKYGFDYSRMKVPTLTFQNRGETSYSVMPKTLKPVIFVNNHLSRMVKGFEMKTKDGIPVSHEIDEHEAPSDESMYEGMSPEQVAHLTELELIETQDDHVAATLWKLRNVKIDRTHLPVLNDKTFYEQIEEQDFTMILFYLKFDAKGMAFLHHYSTASFDLANQGIHALATVDCFDWTDVCSNVNITSYPTVNIYRKGVKTRQYKGMLSTKAVVSTIHLMLAESPFYLQTHEDYNKFIDGQLPDNISEKTDIAVVGLFPEDTSKDLTEFNDAATEFDGKLLFAYITGDLAKSLSHTYESNVPTVVVHRRKDNIKPYSVFTGEFNHARLSDFINSEALSLFPELTVTNLPAYMSKKKPFVILFISKHDTESQHVISDVVKSEHFPGVIFCWMNVTSPRSLASKILSDYSPAATAPALTLVNHQLGSVHNYNGVEITKISITDWIENVLAEKIKPSKMLDNREWKPRHPGYDFLKMIDEEEERKKNEQIGLEDPIYDNEVDNFQGRAVTDDLPDSEVREELHKVLKEETSSRWRSNKHHIIKDESQIKHSHTEL